MLSFLKPAYRDIIDILVVAVVFFYFLRFLKGTRALRMFYALIIILVLSVVVRWLDFKALGLIVDSLKTVWVVIFVILFQPEIRNALARFGRTRAFRFLLKPVSDKEIIEEILSACAILKERKYGALIVIERQIGLKDFIETGTKIEARVSSPLLISIFNPTSPLHDGACIISGDQIIAASCTLPLSEPGAGLFSKGVFWGMRHRAGIGITNVSDAVSIIVSGQTGNISFAEKGRIDSDLTITQLQDKLSKTISK
ncbi:MAG: diadenylate cyclase CdaA [candidate division WOR-3 bacterium]|nr:diadenylate cyclase CdaA [candidate division WOR-3 bacterium]